MQKIHEASEGIMKTVAFFDGLSIPLTDFEIFQYGLQQANAKRYSEISDAIAVLCREGRLKRNGAFVTLPGRTDLSENRIERSMYAEEKYSRALKATRILRYIPFMRLVGICNTLAFDVANKESDIDVFIVTHAKRLYITYALATGIMHLCGLRRWKLRIQNKICLSFYVSDVGLAMERFALPGGDPYLAEWTRSVFPVWHVRGIDKKFADANIRWLNTYFPNLRAIKPVSRYTVRDTVTSRCVRMFFEFILLPFASALESLLMQFEHRRLEKSSARRMRSETTGVVVDDRTLKFHEEDRRAFFKAHMDTHAS